MRDPRPLEEVEKERELGNNEYRKGNWTAALQHYNRSIELWPTTKAYNNRAQTYIKLKKWDEALEDCAHVLMIDGENEKAQYRKKLATIRKLHSECDTKVTVKEADLVPSKISNTLWLIEEKYYEKYKKPYGKNSKRLVKAVSTYDHIELLYQSRKHSYNRADFSATVHRTWLERGSLSVQKQYGYTPLHWTSKQGCEYRTRVLIQSGADKDSQDNEGYSPLLRAIRRKKHAVAKLLIQEGADLSIVGKDGYTALLWAARINSFELIELMVEYEVDVNVQSDGGYTALWWACRKGNLRAAKSLLEAGASPNIKPENESLPIAWAVKNANENLVKLLLAYGVNCNVSYEFDYQGIKVKRHILELATKNGHSKIVHLLLDNGMSPDCSSTPNVSPIQTAAKYNQHRVAMLLVKYGAELNVSDKHTDSPLMYAVHHDNFTLFKYMLEHGSNPNIKENRGFFSPFLKVCIFFRITMLEYLIKSYRWLIMASLNEAAQAIFSCHGQSDLKIKFLRLLFKCGGDVASCYRYLMSRDMTLLDTVCPSIVCLLVRIGLDEPYVYKWLLVKAMQNAENSWMVGLVKAANPMFFNISNIYEELSEKVRGYGLCNAGHIRENLFNVPVPGLFALCVSCIRRLIYQRNAKSSIIPLIYKLPPGVVHAVGWHLSLDIYFPETYFTGQSAAKSVFNEVNNITREGYHKDVTELSDFQVPLLHHLSNLENHDIDDYTKKLFSSELTQKDSTFPFRWVLTQFTDICTESEVQKQPDSNLNNCTPKLLQIDNIMSITESHKSRQLTRLSSVLVNCFMTVLKVDHSLSFTVLPCGSINTGNKVGNLDEVDLIIRWNVRVLHVDKTNTDEALHAITLRRQSLPFRMKFDSIKEVLYALIKEYIDKMKYVFEETGAYLTAFYAYNKAPALCLKLNWVCPENHHHDFSIDFTPMIILDEPSPCPIQGSNTSLLEPIRQMLANAPVCLIPTDSKVKERPRTLTSKWRETTSLHDKRVFEMLDEISPNIRKVYRILKVLRELVFPKVIKYSAQSQLIKSGAIVSSYQLRNAVFNELVSLEQNEISLTELWADSLVSDRIRGCLTHLSECEAPCPLLKRHVSKDAYKGSSHLWVSFISKDINNLRKLIDMKFFTFPSEYDELQLLHEKQFIVQVIECRYRRLLHEYDKSMLHFNRDKVRSNLFLGEHDNIYYYEKNFEMFRKIINIPFVKRLAKYVSRRNMSMYNT